MKRIALFLHGGVAPAGSGFDVPAINGLVRRLAERFELAVYQLSGNGCHAESFLCGGATVYPVRASHGDHLARKISAMVRMFRRHHEQEPYALVHGLWALPGGMASVLAAERFRIPAVVSILGGEAACLPAIEYGNMRKPTSRIATLWTIRRSHAVVCLTETQLNHLRPFGFSRGENVHIVPFGAEESFFSVVPRTFDAAPLRILHVGSLNDVKDQRTLLRAFRFICQQVEAHLRIVGEDVLEGAIHRYVQELGLAERVSFTGYVPHGDLPEHFGWAHLMLQSSLYEGQGVVFAEAAAAGLPICGTRVGLLADLGASFAVMAEPGDAIGLAKAVLSVVRNTGLRASIQENARTWAQEHRGDSVAKHYEEIYRSLTDAEH